MSAWDKQCIDRLQMIHCDLVFLYQKIALYAPNPQNEDLIYNMSFMCRDEFIHDIQDIYKIAKVTKLVGWYLNSSNLESQAKPFSLGYFPKKTCKYSFGILYSVDASSNAMLPSALKEPPSNRYKTVYLKINRLDIASEYVVFSLEECRTLCRMKGFPLRMTLSSTNTNSRIYALTELHGNNCALTELHRYIL
eukprot:882792_1